jgi:hypothetical protein
MYLAFILEMKIFITINKLHMKYLKKFNTREEYEAFKEDVQFIRPNVTLIKSAPKTQKMVFNISHEGFSAADGDFEALDGEFRVRL